MSSFQTNVSTIWDWSIYSIVIGKIEVWKVEFGSFSIDPEPHSLTFLALANITVLDCLTILQVSNVRQWSCIFDLDKRPCFDYLVFNITSSQQMTRQINKVGLSCCEGWIAFIASTQHLEYQTFSNPVGRCKTARTSQSFSKFMNWLMLFRVKINSGNATRSAELMHACERWYNDQHFQKYRNMLYLTILTINAEHVILVKTVLQNHGQWEI